MTKTNLPALAQSETPATPDSTGTTKQVRISKRIRVACDAIVAGQVKTVTDAAALAKLSREHLSRELSKPHVTEYLRQKAYRTLAIAAGRASAVKVELLDSPSEHVRNDASEFVLALAGIKPAAAPAVSLNVSIRAGWVLDLRDDPIDVTRPSPKIIENEP